MRPLMLRTLVGALLAIAMTATPAAAQTRAWGQPLLTFGGGFDKATDGRLEANMLLPWFGRSADHEGWFEVVVGGGVAGIGSATSGPMVTGGFGVGDAVIELGARVHIYANDLQGRAFDVDLAIGHPLRVRVYAGRAWGQLPGLTAPTLDRTPRYQPGLTLGIVLEAIGAP